MREAADSLDDRLQGNSIHRWMQDLFTNTLHFPIANIFLELLSTGSRNYLSEPDIYILLSACIVQSYVLAGPLPSLRARPLPGNLVAPTLYSLAEIGMESLEEFLGTPNHLAYWGVALAIGLWQQLRLWLPRWNFLWTVAESVTRASIILIMYWIFGTLTEGQYYSLEAFFTDDSHIFLGITTLLIGVLLGMAQNTANAYLDLLRKTSRQLKRYSEWLLGRERLARAVENPASLSLHRRERSVLFMDIRGFTAWSEAQPPEAVVDMLNLYCETAEQCWQQTDMIKAKLTGDEIMIVFADVESALRVARCLRGRVDGILRECGLSAGIGLHTGTLVEGLLGGREVKAYDIIGDTVNTAKRLCDNAAGGEILVSLDSCQSLGARPAGELRMVQAKGKRRGVEAVVIPRPEKNGTTTP